MEPQQIRLIDEKGKQLGIFSFLQAQELAKEKGFDLVEVTRKTTPFVYKLGNYGKERYKEEKKRRKQKLKEKHTLSKSIRIGFTEGDHDLKIKLKRLEKFLSEDRIVVIEMRLRGREKAHFDLAREKINNFLNTISLPFKIVQPLKRVPRGLIIALKKN